MSEWSRALRGPLRSPGLSLAIAVTMALGIAAASTFVSIAYSVLLRPLPFRSSERLVVLWAEKAGVAGKGGTASYPDFEDWKARAHAFESMAAQQLWQPTLRFHGEPERVTGAEVSAELFAVLGVTPALGRVFGPADYRPGRPPVVVLSHRLWSELFAADRKILGRSISLDDTASTVIGVLPAAAPLDKPIVFKGAEIFRPLIPSPFFSGRGSRILTVVARLRPAVEERRAAAELSAVGESLAREHPSTNAGWSVRAESLRELTVGGSRAILLLLLVAGLLLLLVACSNVMNMTLVRASQRRREIAVRLALGAGRWRLIRQLLLESAPLAALAALLGLLLTAWGWSTFTALLPVGVVRLMRVSVGGQVVAITAVVTAAVLILTQLVAGLLSSRAPLGEPLRDGSAGSGESRASRRLRGAIVAAEVGLSLVLLIGAGLLIHSLERLSAVDLGFEPERVLVYQLDLPPAKYQEPAQAQALFERIFRRLEGRPGIGSAGVTDELPLTEGNMNTGVGLEPGRRQDWLIDLRGVSPGYFSALGIPVLRGRAFTFEDGARNRNVVILNAAAARRLWGAGAEPIGRKVFIDWGESKTPREVVGMVGDVRHESVESPPRPEVYLPYQQMPFWSVYLAVRTRMDPLAAAGDVRRQIRGADPDLTIVGVTSLPEVVAGAVRTPRTYTRILSFFAVVSLLLAAVGVYGVTAFVAAARRREVGVRMALGAQRRDVVRAIVAEGSRPLMIGVLCGLCGAYALSRLLASFLYGVSALDPAAYGVTAIVLVAVALLAAYVPANRAAGLNPVRALKE